MTDKWRLLKIDFSSYMDFRNSLNLGILRARKEELVPDTVVILRTLKSSMCASYYPDIEKDADMDFLSKRGVQVNVCGACIDARGLTIPELVEGAELGSMKILVDWINGSDRVINF